MLQLSWAGLGPTWIIVRWTFGRIIHFFPSVLGWAVFIVDFCVVNVWMHVPHAESGSEWAELVVEAFIFNRYHAFLARIAFFFVFAWWVVFSRAKARRAYELN